VICNLSDGLIFGVDSALTVSDASGIQKVFEDGEKLFRLADKIGVATYGLAGLEGRSIGSFVREFEHANADLGTLAISEVVERLRAFFLQVYVRFFELIFAQPFDEIPADHKGTIGLLVGGFSPNSFLSEIWEVQIPWNAEPGSARLVYGPGQFGLGWFATCQPIERYLNGADVAFLGELGGVLEGMLNRALTQEEVDSILTIREKYRYKIMLDAMPIQAGIDYVRFLVNLVIGHFRFAATHPIVGGTAKVGVVTYNGESFRLLG